MRDPTDRLGALVVVFQQIEKDYIDLLSLLLRDSGCMTAAIIAAELPFRRLISVCDALLRARATDRAVATLLHARHPIITPRSWCSRKPELVLVDHARSNIETANAILELLSACGLRFDVVATDDLTLLMYAARKSGLERLIAKMIALGADPNETNENGNTALFFCINSPEHIRTLLACGADPTIRNRQGHTAQESARLRESIGGLLLQNSDIDSIIIKMQSARPSKSQ